MLCTSNMSLKIKVDLCKSNVRSAQSYGVEFCAVRAEDEKKTEGNIIENVAYAMQNKLVE